ncbi:MAG TPA: S8 family serine peptidase [Candidatus Lachnoclostridium pullistercoris]|uniref:S8 family serine peptidase n=1 Tax=Candidatus Lachnoclostridium pullistercoris TaxID=2838632 RepID=A0A9D2T5S3_9FIRM|nr:S8 family serine peptidase [Candidatus Lachnoclostridium pullistercoris]
MENLLNLSLDADSREREKSPSLRTGYLESEKKWELIVRCFGDLGRLEREGIRVERLLGGYGIITVPETLIPLVAAMPEIEYVEKPNRLFFAADRGRAASCTASVQTGPDGLTGKGVLVGVIDSGIDYSHPDFRNEDGTTRILELWDQSLGRVFTREEIDQALEEKERERSPSAPGQTSLRQERSSPVPSVDVSGHGTAVAGIAAGNGRASGGRYRGLAYESGILAVKLGSRGEGAFPWTTELMRALDYSVRRAENFGMPLAVNLSFGNTYGSHDGTSLLETYLNTVSGYGRTSVIVGTGNEGAGNGHASGRVSAGEESRVELAVGSFETGFGIQLWKSYTDEFSVSLMAPSGRIIGPVKPDPGTQRLADQNTEILLYHGFPSPYSQAQEIYFELIPRRDYVDSGVWQVLIRGERVVTGRYDLWLPPSLAVNTSTRFLRPDPEITLTLPSTASMAVSVGAYDSSYRSYADFSGRGYTRLTEQVKPDLAAPGVGITAPRAGGGYGTFTGTSFAAPFVTGAVALLMEWGIVRGNDPYLYGEKLKAYLRRGAVRSGAETVWPNRELGYGMLCVGDSLPDQPRNRGS